MTAIISETEAAELEGLVPATKEQKARIKRYQALRTRMDALQAQMDELKDEFRAEMDADNLQGLMVNGKVLVRKSAVISSRTDTKGLKNKYPEIAAEFMIVTTSSRMTIK